MGGFSVLSGAPDNSTADDSPLAPVTAPDNSAQDAPVQGPTTTVQVNGGDDSPTPTTTDTSGDLDNYQIASEPTSNMDVQPQAPPTNTQGRVSGWKGILMGALQGMASGAGGHNLFQGVTEGYNGVRAAQQQTQENQFKQQQLDMQSQQQTNSNQEATDAHQKSQLDLAGMHLQQNMYQKQLALMPDSIQQQQHDEFVTRMDANVADGLKDGTWQMDSSAGTGSFQDMQNRLVQQNKVDPNGALSRFVVPAGTDGNYSIATMSQANQPISKDFEIPAWDANGKPTTPITLSKGSGVTNAQAYQYLLKAESDHVQAMNNIYQHQQDAQIETAQAGPRAYATAAGQIKAQQASMAAPKDANGNWNPSSEPVMLVDGGMDPSQLSKRSKTYDQNLSLANQYSLEKYGKPFDIAQAQTDYKYANQQQTQNTLKMINGMTDQGGAIDIATKAAQALPQTNSQTLNKLFNAGTTEFGSTQETNFHTAMLGLADEYSKVMGGGVSSDTGRQQALDILKGAYSRGQLQGAIGVMQNDIGARKSAIIGGNRYLVRQYGGSQQQSSAQPAGATGKVKGSDGNWYWTDGKSNLGKAS